MVLRMTIGAEQLLFGSDPLGPRMPRSARLEHLVLLPSLPAPARERLDDALGPELARFLIAALSAGQGRGSSSP